MNTAWTIRCKKFLILAALLQGITGISWAGVLLTHSKQTEIGSLVDDGDSISLQSEYGAVAFKKGGLLWYSVERDIDTLFKAGLKARGQGNTQAAIALLELSIAKESLSQLQAQAELDVLKKNMVEAVQTGSGEHGAAVNDITDTLTPEQKIARAQQMIQNGKDMMAKAHLDPVSAEKAKDTSKKVTADGELLLAEGQRELAERQAREAEEARKRRETQTTLVEAKQAHETIEHVSPWTPEEKMVNAAAGGVFALILLLSLWQITMKDARKD